MPEQSPEQHFDRLEKRLVGAGIRPGEALSLVDELHDHYEDVLEELLAEGLSSSAASEVALQRLGSPEAIAARASDYDVLKCWWRRFPRAALVVYPLACAAVLPAVPVIAGVRHRAAIGRWLSCVAGSALVTATILFVLNFALGL